MVWNSRPQGPGNFLRSYASVARRARALVSANPYIPPQNNERVKEGLLSEWWFDEGSGSTVRDHANGIVTATTNLTLSGNYIWKTDSTLDNRSYLSMSSTDARGFNLNPVEYQSLDSLSGITLEAWVRPTNAAGLNPGPGRIMSLSKNIGGATNFQNFMLGHGTWGSAGYAATNYHSRVQIGSEIGVDDQTIQQFTGDGTAKAQLQHVVMTVDYTPPDGVTPPEVTVKTYVDGELKVTSTLGSFGFPIFGCWDDTYTLKIGYDTVNENVDQRSFNGDIFLIAVYSRALSLSEINKNRSQGVLSITPPTPQSTLFINEAGLSPTIPYGQTKDIVVEVSGTRTTNINLVVGASSVSGTYGTDFVIDNTLATINSNEYTTSFELSTSLTLNADIPIQFYIVSATGGNVIQSPGQNIDSYNFTGICNTIEPSSNGFASSGGNYAYQLTLGNNEVASLARCEVNRIYNEDVAFTVSGGGATSGTYAIKDYAGNYYPLPATAVIIVPAGQIPQSFDVSCQPEAGVTFPDKDVITFNLLSVSSASNPSMTINSAASTVVVSSYNPFSAGQAGSVVEPTSGNTGYRLDLTSLEAAETALAPYLLSNGRIDFTDSNVPDGGLVVSGVLFTYETWVRTDKPIKFVDCYFSAAPSVSENHAGKNVSYFVYGGWNDQIEARYGENLEFEYCSFWGCAKAIHLNTRFKRAYKCNFDYIHADYIRFKNGDYLMEECFFGPYMNIENLQWTQADVGPAAEGGIISTTPHADFFQTYQSHTNHVRIKNCTLERANHYYDDGTQNPNSPAVGAHADKIYQMDGSQTKVDKLTFEGCWIYGGMNIFHAIGNSENPNWTNFTLEYINCKLGGSGRRAYTGITSSHSNKVVTATGNVWLDHGVEEVELPQEAITAGNLTANGSTTLNVNDLLSGADFLNVARTGLNEGGKTEWTKRATPL